MPAKFKKKYKSEILKGKAKNVTGEMKKEFAIRVKMFIKTMILDAIQKGISPVNMKNAYPKNTGGKSRYQKYSESYQDQITRRAAYLHFKGGGSVRIDDEDDQDFIDELNEYLIKNGKKLRPVNLKVSGKMLKSLKSKITKNEKVTVWFTDEKAKYHDKEGAGKSKVLRRLLPRGVEEFNRAIQRKIIDAAGEAVKDLL